MTFAIHTAISSPTVSIPEWLTEQILWNKLYADVGGQQTLSAISIKAIYVTGTIFQICESVAVLLSKRDFARQVSYIPALGIYISAVEILGRCIKGETSHRRSTLQLGLKWLCNPSYPEYSSTPKNAIVVATKAKVYTIEDIEALRNFSAHGQAVSQLYVLDYELIEELHTKLTNGLVEFWKQLAREPELCNNLV